MLLSLLWLYLVGVGGGMITIPEPATEEKPLVFSLIPELDSQAVRDAWMRMERETVAEMDKQTEPEPALPPLGVIGAVEPVFIEDIAVAIPARIDTGASISSIDVTDIKHFERDGKPWVSFAIKPRGEETSSVFERRVIKVINVKQHGHEAVTRPLVNLTIRLGDMTLRREFTLADRTKFNYQILLGRNILQGLALIDVSTSNTLQ